MKKPENPFRIFYDRAYDYFTASFVRRVFFFSLVAVFIISVIMQFFEANLLLSALYLACAFTSFATMVDSMQKQREFNNQIHDMKADYVVRNIEKHGEDAELGEAFSDVEQAFLKKKKREHTFSVMVKFIFTVTFIVLFGGSI